MSTTRWIDNKEKDLNKAIALLIDDVSQDEKVGVIAWDHWDLKQVFSENKQITYNGRTIMYNMVEYAYDQISTGDQPLEDRTVKKKGTIIAYKTENAINYIIDQNSSAQKLLRRLMSYGGKNEIEKNTFNLTNDFFVWLINRVYNSNGIIETVTADGTQLQLEAIKGFRGDVEDLQTKVSATGESVMNIISALSFLLESNSLRQIRVDLSLTGHENINLLLQKDVVKIEVNEYQGKYESDDHNEKIAKLYLMAYLEILPILMQEYNTDLLNEEWSKARYSQFLRTVADDVKNKIESKIDSIDTK